MTDAITETSTAAPDRMRVWDAPLRVFHWGLVAAFTLAWLTADEWQTAHEIAGYAVAGLVAFRLVWGFAGNRHARFARFLRGPVATLDYLRDMLSRRERRYLGHNPAGAAMTLALLVTLSATAFTGWQIAEPARPALWPDPPQVLAPADETRPARRGDREEEALEDLHEALADLLLLLVALHVAGVALASFRHQENLARAMVTGDKRPPGPGDIA